MKSKTKIRNRKEFRSLTEFKSEKAGLNVSTYPTPSWICEEQPWCNMLYQILFKIFYGDNGDYALGEQDRLFVWGLLARGIAFVMCLSFSSLSFQVLPLAGKNGVTPFYRLLDAVRADLPAPKRYLKLPTIFWLTGASDLALRLVVLAGFLSALLALIGGAYSPVFFSLAWMFYLSLNYCVGLTFPWDAFLLEAGFLCAFFAPLPTLFTASDVCANDSALSMNTLPHPLHQWLFRWLLARLMLGFGKLKFIGTNSSHHCYIKGFLIGQPMPTKVGWLGYHLPLWFHKFSLVIMFVVEIIMPFLLFSNSYLRTIAGISFVKLMIGIQLTGNFGYFNILTATMSIQTLDTGSALTWNDLHVGNPLHNLYTSVVSAVGGESDFHVDSWRHVFIAALHVFLAVGGAGYFLFNSWCSNSWMDWPVVAHLKGALGHLVNFYRAFGPFRVVNSYGVFPPTSAPPVRWVVIMEGTDDEEQKEETWKEYHWRFMTSGPGDHPECAPRFVAPHHPRLDHSLFYTAVGMDNSNYLATVTIGFPYRFAPQTSMTQRLAARMLQGGAGFQAMSECFFSNSPFQDPEAPPTAVRASMYVYHPVSLKVWWASGCTRWYERKRVGEHMQATRLDDILNDSFWVPPPELFHPDSTMAWKRSIPTLHSMASASNSIDVAAVHGSPPERCGGINVTEEDVYKTFWGEWICDTLGNALSKNQEDLHQLTALRGGDQGEYFRDFPFFVYYAEKTKSQFTPYECRVLELILGRLSHRLVLTWLELYFQEDCNACTREQGIEFHKRLKQALGVPPSFMVLEMLAHFIILSGEGSKKYDEALQNPIEAALEAAEHISIENGLLLQITLRIDVFKYHGRKFKIAQSFSTDAKKASKEGREAGEDEYKVPLLPGFLHLNEWFCTDVIQQGLGILSDQDMPSFEKPTPGGEWKVRWNDYFKKSRLIIE